MRGVPRFVQQDAYTESFSYEWQRFRHTQLDSFTGRHDTRDRLQASLNFPLDELRGKRVLDAGCGMGRFAEIVHAFGGEYVGLDYSFAVDAAQENVGHLAGRALRPGRHLSAAVCGRHVRPGDEPGRAAPHARSQTRVREPAARGQAWAGG